MLDCLSSCEGKSLFHDFELTYIVADYRNKQVTIQLKSPRFPQNIHDLKLFGVQHFQMEVAEPWGKGIYVAGTHIKQDGSIHSMEMQLNSGDLVTAEFERAEFNGE